MPKSASWSVILTTAVPDGASTEVPTPGYDAALAAEESVQLAVDNDIVPTPDKATVAFNGETATVTNLTGDDWLPGWTVYLYLEAKGAEDVANQMQVEIDILHQRVKALEETVSTHESEINDLQARVAALETAPASASKM
jgi:hypothetical protein